MIGIDLVDIARFESSRHLPKFIKRFQIKDGTPVAVAKTWACLEAITKAEDQAFDPTSICIKFPPGCRPQVHDPDQVLSGSYVLSVSHQGQMVTAVAIRA